MSSRLDLRIIVFHKNERWVAQCLEHDICVISNEFDTLQTRMEDRLRWEDNASKTGEKNGLESLPPAPDIFFHKWDERSIFNELGRAGNISYEMALYVEHA